MVSHRARLEFEGAAQFRLRVAMAAINAHDMAIDKIHYEGVDAAGLQPHEAGVLKLLELLSPASRIRLSVHNTRVEVDAGLLEGREEQFVFECPNTRGIAYYVEFLLLLAPFLKFPLRAMLTGLTHCATDAAVASLAQTVCAFQHKVGLPECRLEVLAHGLPSEGGGRVRISHEVLSELPNFRLLAPEKVTKISANAFSCHMARNFTDRISDEVYRIFRLVNANVVVKKSLFGKEKAGKSPGFGLELVAETPSSLRFATDFCVAKSQCGPDDDLFALCEQRAQQLCNQLLAELSFAAPTPASLQWYVIWVMALANDSAPSYALFGALTGQSICLLRTLRDKFQLEFDIHPLQQFEEAKVLANLPKLVQLCTSDAKSGKHVLQGNVLLRCRGLHVKNINRVSF